MHVTLPMLLKRVSSIRRELERKKALNSSAPSKFPSVILGLRFVLLMDNDAPITAGLTSTLSATRTSDRRTFRARP